MEGFIARLVKDFESGKITRRQFCEAIGLAAVVCGAGAAAEAAPARGLKLLGLNHISYSSADYGKTRDFYSSVLGMQVLNDNGKDRVNLAFGPKPGKEGQFTGGQFLVSRGLGNAPARPAKSTIDGVCYTVENWNAARIETSLKATGVNPVVRADRNSIEFYDFNNFRVQLASNVGENAQKA